MTRPDLDDGIYPDLPMEDYLALPRLSASGAHTITSRCPATYRYGQDEPDDEKFSHDAAIGTAAHIMTLEPHKWDEKVQILDFKNYQTKAAKEARDAGLAEGKTPLLTKQVETVLGMHDALKRELGDIFSHGVAERSLLWTAENFSASGARVKMRSRPDFTSADDALMVDFKTTASAHPKSFRSRIIDNGHHMQAAGCVEAHGILTGKRAGYLWVVQETKPPYLPAVYEAGQVWLSVGRDLLYEAADIYARCMAADQWPGYLTGKPEKLEPPSWMLYDHDARLEARRQSQRAATKAAPSATQLKTAADWQKPL